MAIRIPWDQYEAAYLLLVCIDVIENHTDRATAIKKVSETLRKRALHSILEFLCASGYLARKSYGKMDELISQANLLRMNKGD